MEMKENVLPTTPQFRHILPKGNIPTPKIRDILPSLAPSEGEKLKEYECDKCGKKLHSKKNLEKCPKHIRNMYKHDWKNVEYISEKCLELWNSGTI